MATHLRDKRVNLHLIRILMTCFMIIIMQRKMRSGISSSLFFTWKYGTREFYYLWLHISMSCRTTVCTYTV